MKDLLLLLTAAFLAFSHAHHEGVEGDAGHLVLRYDIAHTWDGYDIPKEREHVHVELSVCHESHNLIVSATGPFYDNLTPRKPKVIGGNCAPRPFWKLWLYEVHLTYKEHKYTEINFPFFSS